jgi:hypothetical protein
VEAVLVLIQEMVVLVALVAAVAAQEVMREVLVHQGKVMRGAQVQVLQPQMVQVVAVAQGL